MFNERFLEGNEIVPAFSAVAMDLSAVLGTGDWVNLKNYERCLVLFCFGEDGTDTEEPVLTIEQATAAAGTGNKALNFTDYWHKFHATDLALTPTWTKVTAVSGNTLDTVAIGVGSGDLMVAIEFQATDLDASGGFTFLQCSVADTGATGGASGCLLYILSQANVKKALADSAVA